MDNRARPAAGAHWLAATPPNARSMENSARPAAGAHWLAATRPNLRARVVQKIMNILSPGPAVFQDNNFNVHNVASNYEAKVFSQSNDAQDYLRTISQKMMRLQQKKQSDLRQQQAQVGRHQMRPVNAVLANSSAGRMLQTASAIPLPVRPPQAQIMHSRVNQAQPAKLPPVAPVVQLHPCHPAAVTQTRTLCQPRLNSTQQPPQPNLMRTNQQDLRVEQRQSYQTHNGQPANFAIMQTRQCGEQQIGKHQPAAGVDWREDMFQKIISLKDAHWSELMEFARSLQSFVFEIKANGQKLESFPKVQHTMGRVKSVLSFLQIQKTNIPEAAKDHLGKWQNVIGDLLRDHRAIKANNARCQSQNCHQPPQVVSSSSATDNNRHEHQAAEALPHSSENTPSGTPLSQQENHSDNLAGEAEDNTVRGETESPVPVNLPADTAAFTGGTCSPQRHPADEAIPQLTQTVEHAVTSPPQQNTHTVRVEGEDDLVRAEGERLVGTEALIKRGVDAARSLSPVALRGLANDMGVNLKRAFRHTTSSNTMDDSSCVRFDDESGGKRGYKRQKTHYSTLPDEISATHKMLVETEMRISEDDTAGADGTVIELCYTAVSLAPVLREAICASEISMKLLVPADYPQSSPVILGGEPRNGVPGVVDMAFRRALVLLPEPRSIQEMAKTWDSIVRRSVMVFAHRVGGGTYSTRCCIPV